MAVAMYVRVTAEAGNIDAAALDLNLFCLMSQFAETSLMCERNARALCVVTTKREWGTVKYPTEADGRLRSRYSQSSQMSPTVHRQHR